MTYEECEQLVFAYKDALRLGWQVDGNDAKESAAMLADSISGFIASLIYRGLERQ